MAIKRAARPSQQFTQIRNDVLRDDRISFRARGLLAAILSYPDDWSTTSEALARAGSEGRDAIRTALAELETAGYMKREKVQDERGRWATHSIVYDTAEPAQPPLFPTEDGFPGVGSPVVGKSGPIKNTINKHSSPNGEAASAAPDEAKAINPADAVAKAVYDHAEGMVKYMAIRTVAIRALKLQGQTVESITATMVRLYDIGKPLTLTTVGQAVAGNNGSTARQDDSWGEHWNNPAAKW